MQNRRLTDYLPRPAMIVAVVALIAAFAGTATAANGLINGKKIKPGTVTSKQIKNRSIGLVDIKKNAVKNLRGAKGERGPAGPQGPKGEAGPAGVIAPLSATAGLNNVEADTEEELVSISVEKAGSYIIQAKTNLFAQITSADVECRIAAGGSDVDNVRWTANQNSDRQPVSLMALSEVGAGGTISLFCDFSDSAGGTSATKLIAIPVA